MTANRKELLSYFYDSSLIKNILYMLLFGVLTQLMSLIKFYVFSPEIDAGSDFAEIPLLISIFYITNPFYLLGISLVSLVVNGFATLSAISYCGHSISIIILWFTYQYINKVHKSVAKKVFSFLGLVLIHYFVFLIPLASMFYPIGGLPPEAGFWEKYSFVMLLSRFEIITTSAVVSLYLLQLIIRKDLIHHKKNLEMMVLERTEELKMANEELKTLNEQLLQKNYLINDQNEELRTAMKVLEDTQLHLIQTEKMASLGVLTAGVAHEINNPLNFIMGGYEGLKIYFQENTPKNGDVNILLDGIYLGIKRASEIVLGLNQFSRDSNNYTEECDIHQIIDNCLMMNAYQTKNRIQVIKKYSNTGVFCIGNVGNMHQVFINILSNAIQSIKNNGLIEISTYSDMYGITVTITDNGVGIKKEDLNRITDPFFTTKDPGKGTGLGLSVVYGIIQKHQGRIEFSSKPDIGTSVKIFIPKIELNH